MLPKLLDGRIDIVSPALYLSDGQALCHGLVRIFRRETTTMATRRKSDLGARVAGKLGGSRAQGEAALNAVLHSIQEELAGGNKVVLTGFGSFDVRNVRATRVRAIRGGQEGNLITVPAHKRVGFKAGTELARTAQ